MHKLIFILAAISATLLATCDAKHADKNSSRNDSIKKYLDLASNDTLPYTTRIKYNDKAYSFVDLNRNDSLTKEYLSTIINNTTKTNNWEKEKLLKAISKSECKSDILRNLGITTKSGNFQTLDRYCEKYFIDISHLKYKNNRGSKFK